MELLQIRYFVELAHSGHLSKTAEKIMVTPSAISSSIKRLEDELGVKLFDRIGRNIVLNKYGRAYLMHMESVLQSIDLAKAELDSLASRAQQVITFCATSPQLWDDALVAFHVRYPDVSVRRIAFDTGGDQSRILTRHMDFVVASSGSINHPNWESQQLFQNKMYLAVPRNHRFADRESIDLAEAKDELFINSLSDTSFREYCDDLCRRAGFKPKSKIECDYLLRPKMLAQENMVCITTNHGRLTGIFDGAVLLRIVNPVCTRPQSLYWEKSHDHSAAFVAFKEFMVEYYKDYEDRRRTDSGE